jgi:hypothetical protein
VQPDTIDTRKQQPVEMGGGGAKTGCDKTRTRYNVQEIGGSSRTLQMKVREEKLSDPIN